MHEITHKIFLLFQLSMKQNRTNKQNRMLLDFWLKRINSYKNKKNKNKKKLF